MAGFESRILKWYNLNKRELPWRLKALPYRVWVSEIILQQTRVDQGISYYHRFVEAFPDVMALHRADEQKVLKMWQGLGYYSRARNLKKAAAMCATQLKGKLPNTFSDWLKMPGVGEYTAAAIASICFNEKVPVLDGNVFRVMSRYLACDLPVDEVKNKSFFREEVAKRMVKGHFGDFNQGLMELGALICRPRNPICNECPLREDCKSFSLGNFHDYPIKKSKNAVKNRFLSYAFIETTNEVFIQLRKGNSIWKGLYEFPILESENKISLSKEKSHWKKFISQDNFYLDKKPIEIKHLLSHRVLHMRIWHLRLEKKINLPGGQWISKKALSEYPFPQPLAQFLKRKGL